MTKPITFRGTRYTIPEIASMTGINAVTLRQRLALGWTIEQTVTIPTPTQRKRGVVSNLDAVLGTGAGSTAQEIAEITFPESEASQ